MSIDPRRSTPSRFGRDPRDRAPDICAEVIRQSLMRHAADLRALVLTGSLARGEATIAVEGDRCRVLGDAEFLAVFADGAPRPPAAAVHETATRVETALADRLISCPITLSAVPEAYLRALRPAIFAYELRSCGRVIWGDPTVLRAIPQFSARDIPPEDAWRLLCNRLVEQLEVMTSPEDSCATASPEAHYRMVKLHLDMATSFLVFAGAYEPTYQARSERLLGLAGDPQWIAEAPFPLEPFARAVEACTRWKLDGGDAVGEDPPPWGPVLDRARRLWRWELLRLTRGGGHLPDRALLDALLARQSAAARARGWLHVVRRCGWHRSWRLWPRWARLARRGSPRYLVYTAACQTLFWGLGPPSLETDAAGGDPVRTVVADLPVVRPWAHPGFRPWADVIADIAFNYRKFLVDTRA
jgi:hypothetical protein